MMQDKTIYSINTYDGIIDLLCYLGDEYQITLEDIVTEIDESFNCLITEFNNLGLKYEDFKNILIPHKKNREFVFIFDALTFPEGVYNYGHFALSKVMDYLDKNISTAFITGDIISNQKKEIYADLVLDFNFSNTNEDFKYNQTEYFIIALNNITESRADMIHSSLINERYYAGYKSIYYESSFKKYMYISHSNKFIKQKNNILMEAPFDEISNNKIIETGNFHGFTFNNMNYFNVCDYYFDVFLKYYPAVEFGQLGGRNTDIVHKFATNKGINKNIELQISEDKFNYLTKNSKHNIDFTKDELISIIKGKINNLEFYEIKIMESKSKKNLKYISFMIIFEVHKKKYKCIIQYIYKQYEVVTMYEVGK